MIKKTVFVVMMLTCMAFTGNAQEYRSGIGLRGGMFNGISFKHFVNPDNAFEIVAALRYRGPFVAGMYQIHANAFDVPGLAWYYGPGAYIGFVEGRYRGSWFDQPDRTYTILGVNGVVGLEYKIDEIPITIGVDVTPALHLLEFTHFTMGAGITVRYVF